MLEVQSGKLSVAAAYEVTGVQLATYLEAVHSANGSGAWRSVWREQPNKVVDLCLIDGDMRTQTPGPPEADRSAVRVAVVIEDDVAKLWEIARSDKSQLPITDPATVPDSSPT